jgi:uncharacterized protein (TIGR02117 family)
LEHNTGSHTGDFITPLVHAHAGRTQCNQADGIWWCASRKTKSKIASGHASSRRHRLSRPLEADIHNVMRKNILLLFLVMLCGCSARPYVVKSQKTFTGLGSNEVYVVSHGWHTSFVVPAKYIQTEIPKLKNRFGNTQYIEFGWGDRGFYQAQEITSGLTIRAIFWPTESVVHAVSVSEDPYRFFSTSEVERLCLSGNELSSLVGFIVNSFYKDTKGEVVGLKSGIYGDSQFYKGVGDYYLMNTCNKWTAKGLRSTGMNISPTFKLTAGSVMSYVNDANQVLINACTRPQ